MEEPGLFNSEKKRVRKILQPQEFKVIALRECPVPDAMTVCETAEQAATYWHMHIEKHPHFNPECECFAVLMLNTRCRIKGHQLVSMGLQDSVFVHPREVFRTAVTAAAAKIVLMHNHPSGDPTPSDMDLRITRDLIKAGQLLKIEIVDHVVVGNGKNISLRELGYFSG